jgi:hypothetical protein
MYLTPLKIVRTSAAASLNNVSVKWEHGGEYIRFIVVSLGTYTIKQLAAGTEIEAEIKIVGGLIYHEGIISVRDSMLHTSK